MAFGHLRANEDDPPLPVPLVALALPPAGEAAQEDSETSVSNMAEQPKSGDLLEQAKALYLSGVAAYRDALLDVGRLLHQFVLARLEEGDGLSEESRFKARLTRRAVVETAATALGVNRQRVNNLIVTAMAADLLGGGIVGDMGIQAIYRFRVYVRRRHGLRGVDAGRRNGPPVSDMERWEIKPGFEKKAKAEFERAVTQGYTQLDAKMAADKSGAAKPTMSRRKNPFRSDERATAVETVRKSAKQASPGDVADLCMEIIGATADPRATALALQARLAVYASRRTA